MPMMSEHARQLFPLSQLIIHLSRGCSPTCRSCRAPSLPEKNGKNEKRLPSEIAMRAVLEALPLGLRAVNLVGGSSLLHPGLEVMLNRLESLELHITIETDGTGVTSRRAKRLARLPQRSVWVGLDGTDAATHDTIHRKAGSFQMATRAILTLAEAGLAPNIVFSVRRANAAQISGLVRLVESLGGASILFSILPPDESGRPYPGSSGHPPLAAQSPGANSSWHGAGLQVPELIALGWRVERDLANATRLSLRFEMPPVFHGLHPLSFTGGLGQPHNPWRKNCNILNGISLLPSGAYALCELGASRSDFVLGQAGPDSLEQIWNNHPLLQQLREGMPERLEGVCQRCTVKNACMGFCPGENYLDSGSFWSPHWFCETAEKAGLFPAGRLIENHW